jgi:hypothetical protein
VTSLHFCERGWKPVPKYIKRMCYKGLWNLLTQPSSVVRNESSSITQLLPTWPRQPSSGCEGTFQPSSAPRIGPRGIQTSTPWKLWAVLEDMVCQKRHNNLENLKRSLVLYIIISNKIVFKT